MSRLSLAVTIVVLAAIAPLFAAATKGRGETRRWVGTWAAAPQPNGASAAAVLCNQTVRLVVHTSIGGTVLRIRLSNAYGDSPLVIGRARIARRIIGAEIDPASDRELRFRGQTSIVVAARSQVISDPVEIEVRPLSDVAVSLFFPQCAVATTSHVLALQTSYMAHEPGDATAKVTLARSRPIHVWPFLTGVDVLTSDRGAAVVAFGDSRTDGDGSTRDGNARWPDLLARRLQDAHGDGAELGVLNLGIIGNRLLHDSPRQPDNPFGPIFGEAASTRFERDVIEQPGVEVVIVSFGINDIWFPRLPFTPSSERVTARALISAYRRLAARAHERGIRVIGTTIAPYENAKFPGAGFDIDLYSSEGERVRSAVNEWIRRGGDFDGVVDFDAVLRDPARPARLRPVYDSGDHLHINDAGNAAQADAFPLDLFGSLPEARRDARNGEVEDHD